jgi:hypothetical protein
VRRNQNNRISLDKPEFFADLLHRVDCFPGQIQIALPDGWNDDGRMGSDGGKPNHLVDSINIFW